MPGMRTPALGPSVSQLIVRELEGYLADPTRATIIVQDRRTTLPPEIANALDVVLTLDQASYRDGVIIQLAFGLLGGPEIDLTKRLNGGRAIRDR